MPWRLKEIGGFQIHHSLNGEYLNRFFCFFVFGGGGGTQLRAKY